MKKISFTALTCLLLLLTACRKDVEEMIYNENYTTYEQQFKSIWSGVNSVYVHWSADTVDWDARYRRLLPQFQSLDKIVNDTSLPDSLRSIPYETFAALYTELFQGMIDHHMEIEIKNLKPAPGESTTKFSYFPGLIEVINRDYLHGLSEMLVYNLTMYLLELEGHVTELEYKKGRNTEVIVGLIDGKYAYMKLSDYNLSTSANDDVARTAYEHWLEMCFRPTTQGIILDNRGNPGGNSKDMELVISPFLDQDMVLGYSRTKNGPGRYDYTPWATHSILKAQQTRPDIPYVVLADIWSGSMGELTTAAVKALPQGYFIGERTYGAFGAALTIYNTNTYEPFTVGELGGTGKNHHINTTTYQYKFADEGILEGIGITPDQEVLYTDYRNQLDAAINYLNSVSKEH